MTNKPPPKPVSRDEFVESLGATGIFAADELHKLLASLPTSPTDPDATFLANQLTSAGKLTPFQAEAVLERRGEELLFGNYEVLERLGSGGMGTVYKARHRRMKRVVAIKVLSRAIATDPTFLQRFQREVETIARLSHPNIVMAFDADEAEVGPYLVMEFVNGRDLATKVQTQGKLPIADAVDCILQAARGLAYAHAQGIVHRDIKPANLIQDSSGVVKVADLGLARLSNSRAESGEASSLTQAGSVVGTADFMPPEQAMGSTPIDHRADIYSLGCTLFYLVSGHPPYVTGTMMGTLLKHQAAAIPSLCVARPDTPNTLDEICRKMMAKLPDERYSSMTEVVKALETVWVMGSESAATLIRPPSSIPHSPFPLPPSPRGRSVLLVEPSRTQAVIVRKYLQDLGIPDVQSCSSGQKALEMIRSSPPDIVISAMHLTDTTGVELAHWISAEPHLSSVGFVLVASESDANEASALRVIPNAVFLPKPFDLTGLEQAIGALRKG